MFTVTACRQCVAQKALPIYLSFKRFESKLTYSQETLQKVLQDAKEDEHREHLFARWFKADVGKLPLTVELRNNYWRKGGFTDYVRWKNIEAEWKGQMYDESRHLTLGPDLSAAHFVYFRGGGVKFSNCNEWLYSAEKHSLAAELPCDFDENYILTGIDISHLDLRLEALTNFNDLTRVTHLSIAFCPRADDWWLDFISGKLSALQHLDLAGCPKITYRGISCLYRCEELKSLNLEGAQHTLSLEMTLLKLEELFPGLVIFGTDHWSVESDEGKVESNPAQ